MKMLARAGALMWAALLISFAAAPAAAQNYGVPSTAPQGVPGVQAACVIQGDGTCIGVDASHPLPVSSSGSSSVTPTATSAAVSCQVAKASAGTLYAATLYSSASGWFLIFNATSAPADGAVTPIEFLRYPTADVTMGYTASPGLTASTGIVICFSTTGPYTKTASATATISSKVQ